MIDMQGGMEIALGNGARAYQYKVNIAIPSDVDASGFMIGNDINTLCKTTMIPGTRISQRAFYDNGHIYNLPSNRVNDTEWTATFYLDDSYLVRNVLEKWIATLDRYNGQEPKTIKTGTGLIGALTDFVMDTFGSTITTPIATSGEKTALDGIFGDMKADSRSYAKGSSKYLDKADISVFGEVAITQMSITGGEIVIYKLYNAYPIMLSPVQFDDSRIESINEFNCSFAFSDYEIIKPKSLIGKLVSAVL
jgi:hypothetical protein